MIRFTHWGNSRVFSLPVPNLWLPLAVSVMVPRHNVSGHESIPTPVVRAHVLASTTTGPRGRPLVEQNGRHAGTLDNGDPETVGWFLLALNRQRWHHHRGHLRVEGARTCGGCRTGSEAGGSVFPETRATSITCARIRSQRWRQQQRQLSARHEH